MAIALLAHQSYAMAKAVSH